MKAQPRTINRWPALAVVVLLTLLVAGLSQTPDVHAAVIIVDDTADEINPGNGFCTLREAILNANLPAGGDDTGGDCTAGAAGADSITLPDGTYTLALAGASEDANATGDLDITDSLTINGGSQLNTVVDGADLDRVFDIRDNSITVEFNDMTIRFGHAPDGVSGAGQNGGGIYARGTVTLTRVTVDRNEAGAGDSAGSNRDGGNGGGIYIHTNTSLTLVDSAVTNNHAGDGGDVSSGTVFAGQGGFGGGIYARNVDLTITDSDIIANTSGDGGDCTDYICGSGGFGGGIYAPQANIDISGSDISNNIAGDGGTASTTGRGGGGGRGGGLYVASGNSTVTIENDTYVGFNQGGDGGDSPTDSAGDGGRGAGLYLGGTSQITLQNGVIVSNNDAGDGGDTDTGEAGEGGRGAGIYFSSDANNADLTDVVVVGNNAGSGGDATGSGGLAGDAGNGGGIYIPDLTVTLTDVVIDANRTFGGGTDQFDASDDGMDGDGGGLYLASGGSLTATNVLVESNEARRDGGGIVAVDAASLTLSDSEVSGNTAQSADGGGLLVADSATAEVTDSTISDNFAQAGGGGIAVDSSAEVTLEQSLVVDNTAITRGGGALVGIFESGTLQAFNSTFSDNFAPTGGGVYVNENFSSFYATNVTITNNETEGLHRQEQIINPNTVELVNTLIADQNDGDDCGGDDPNSLGHNLDSDGSCGLTATGDLPNNANANLGPLLNNGGPTLTHALQPGSSAINAGDDALALGPGGGALTSDQRGAPFSRFIGTVDIGAFERDCPGFPTTVADEFELNRAVICFNSETTSGDREVTLTTDIPLTASTIPVANGTDSAALIVDGQDYILDGQDIEGVRPFSVMSGKATLLDISITGGRTTEESDDNFGGGGIAVGDDGELTLLRAAVFQNTSVSGGGIASLGLLDVQQSNIAGNDADLGGGILGAGETTVSFTTVTGNLATGDAFFGGGGGIAQVPPASGQATRLEVSHSTIDNNQAPNGGGILLEHFGNGGDFVANVSNSTISGNTADFSGGGVLNNGFKLTMNNNTLVGNSAAPGEGGGLATGLIFCFGADVEVLMADGSRKRIADVQVGDQVLSYDFEQDRQVTGVVTDTVDREVKRLLRLNGLEVTGEHPFAVGHDLWKPAAELEVGDRVIGPDGGWTTIHTIEEIEKETRVFNITVEGAHNYYVSDGEAQYLVHNKVVNLDQGDTELNNSIITDSTGGDCWVDGDIFGSNNLIDDHISGDCSGVSSAQVTNLDLALSFNGGPTMTHALLSGSNAIDGGDDALALDAGGAPLVSDQRGLPFARFSGASVDVGAFEVQACPAFPIQTGTELDLAEAIVCFNDQSTPGDYTVELTADIPLSQSLPAIDNDTAGVALIIDGSGYTVDGQEIVGVRPFGIAEDTTVTLEEITVTRGSASLSGEGGGIRNGGDLTLVNSTVSASRAHNSGGIDVQSSAKLLLVGSTVSGNEAVNAGGGISASASSEIVLINSTVSGNTAAFTGGIGSFGTTTLINSTVTGNTGTTQEGGIIHQNAGVLTLDNSLIAGNIGGDCTRYNGTINVQNSLIGDGLTCVNGTNVNNLTGDPNLGPLQDNGGPTETHELLVGSTAIDAGDSALAVDNDAQPLDTDQRGAPFQRIVGLDVDMGAYEFGAGAEPDACPDVPGNIIDNYCFEDGHGPWLFFTNGQGQYLTSTTDPYQGAFAADINIAQQGSNVQLYQKNLPLQPHTDYEISFAAYSTNGANLRAILHEHDDDYTNYGLNLLADLQTGYNVYTATFTTKGFNSPVNDGRLRFWMAPFDQNGMTYRIDWVVLREVNGGNPPIPPDPPVTVPGPGECNPPVAGNLIANPGFEDGTNNWTFWTDGAGSFDLADSDPYECDQNAVVDISASGSNVQLYQKNIHLEPQTSYRLRLAGRADSGQNAALFLQKHGAPYSNYGLNGVVLDLTEEWQVFVVDFTTNNNVAAPVNDARLRIWLADTDNPGASFEFDDVVLVEQEALVTTAAAGGVAASSVQVQGYFLDGDTAGRLAGAHVPDAGPALCYNARASVPLLWPANGRLQPVGISGLGSPDSVTITSVTQDEPTGTSKDARDVGQSTVRLRAERDPFGEGRVYTLNFTAVYGEQWCSHQVVVGAPLQRGLPAVDNGSTFDSTRLTPAADALYEIFMPVARK